MNRAGVDLRRGRDNYRRGAVLLLEHPKNESEGPLRRGICFCRALRDVDRLRTGVPVFCACSGVCSAIVAICRMSETWDTGVKAQRVDNGTGNYFEINELHFRSDRNFGEAAGVPVCNKHFF